MKYRSVRDVAALAGSRQFARTAVEGGARHLLFLTVVQDHEVLGAQDPRSRFPSCRSRGRRAAPPRRGSARSEFEVRAATEAQKSLASSIGPWSRFQTRAAAPSAEPGPARRSAPVQAPFSKLAPLFGPPPASAFGAGTGSGAVLEHGVVAAAGSGADGLGRFRSPPAGSDGTTTARTVLPRWRRCFLQTLLFLRRPSRGLLLRLALLLLVVLGHRSQCPPVASAAAGQPETGRQRGRQQQSTRPTRANHRPTVATSLHPCGPPGFLTAGRKQHGDGTGYATLPPSYQPSIPSQVLPQTREDLSSSSRTHPQHSSTTVSPWWGRRGGSQGASKRATAHDLTQNDDKPERAERSEHPPLHSPNRVRAVPGALPSGSATGGCYR